jgi:hypothetical protein
MAPSGRNNSRTLDWRQALQNDIPLAQARKRRVSYGLMDVFVIAACSLTFAAVIGAGRHGEPKHPPIELIAQDLGTTPEAFREAADRFLPHRPMGPPTEAQKRQFAAVLDVSVEQLDAVMEKYRPDRLRQR